MQLPGIFEKISSPIEKIQTRYNLSTCFVLLFAFFLIVISVCYIIPLLDYGRYVGTDDYTHVGYTQGMDSSLGIFDFYTQMAGKASNPEDPENFYNYPFGLWLFGSLISKITGLSVFTGNYIVIFLYLIVILGAYYIYSGVFLETKEQRIIALLFMVSMPNVALILLNYRPSVFVLPFIFLIFYIALKESVLLKHYILLWLFLFIITITHTGSFIFIISVFFGFFLIYSLFWGKFLRTAYITLVSTFIIYIMTLAWFPEISNQYETKSTLFLTPGNFLANKFNLVIAQDFTQMFYQNFFVGQELVYAILLAVALYGTSRILIAIHKRTAAFLSKRAVFPAFVLPVQNISHSVAAAPIWVGPLHVLLSIPGFFRLDSKGKCLFITVILTTVLPDLLNTSEGIEVATGALREISYLIIIIPITATLGLVWTFSYLKTKLSEPNRNRAEFVIWLIVLSAVILTPALATTYYLPRIAGEDYSVDGMKWLGANGDADQKVIGYGLRTVPVYTSLSTPTIADGSETRAFKQLLQNIFFSTQNQKTNANYLRMTFDVTYVLLNDKILANLGKTSVGLTIDSNPELNKIYSTRDFGIYEVESSSLTSIPEYTIGESTSMTKTESEFLVKSDYYTASLDENTPTLNRFGTKQKNLFGAGFLTENFVIAKNLFLLSDQPYSREIVDNQVIYSTVLKHNKTNYASLLVRYTFYPKVIKREFILTNDLLGGNKSSGITAKFSSMIFSPLSNYIITNNLGRLDRHIYDSQDTIEKAIKVEDIYMFNTEGEGSKLKQGIRIKNIPTSPFPQTIYYKGSTLYDLSSITTVQSYYVPSGSSLHITQFLASGDELGTENNIASQNAVQLNNYPDGIKPIVVMGLSSSESGFALLKQFGIPYSQVIRTGSTIVDLDDTDFLSEPDSELEADEFFETESVSTAENQTQVTSSLVQQGSSIIGMATMVHRIFDDIPVQEKTIASLVENSRNQGYTMDGFMPSSFRFNLDTIKALDNNRISFVLSSQVTRPIQGYYDEGFRNPGIAYYQNEPTDIVMMPVSYPTSSSLYLQDDPDVVFSQWSDILKEVADNDELIVFLFNSADIGDPTFSGDFSSLFAYAQKTGYTFTSPEIIAEHFRQLQNIEYSGYSDMDIASINVTNNNDKMVRDVTFKVDLDKLASGRYITNIGEIVKTEATRTNESIYVSMDIPAHTSQNLIIVPDSARKNLNVQLPVILSEGKMIISVSDANGKPIPNADIIFDTNLYRTGKDGTVTINAHRGTYTIIVQSPGYEKYTKIIEVKGRLASLLQHFNII